MLSDKNPDHQHIMSQRIAENNLPPILMLSKPVKGDDTFFGHEHHRIKTISNLLLPDFFCAHRTTTVKDTRDNTWYRIFYHSGHDRSNLPTRDSLHGSYAPIEEQVACVLKKFDIYFYAIHGYEYRFVMEKAIQQDLLIALAQDMLRASYFAEENIIKELKALLCTSVREIHISADRKECRFSPR